MTKGRENELSSQAGEPGDRGPGRASGECWTWTVSQGKGGEGGVMSLLNWWFPHMPDENTPMKEKGEEGASLTESSRTSNSTSDWTSENMRAIPTTRLLSAVGLDQRRSELPGAPRGRSGPGLLHQTYLPFHRTQSHYLHPNFLYRWGRRTFTRCPALPSPAPSSPASSSHLASFHQRPLRRGEFISL